MEFLFDLLLTAFFSLLFAFLLSKLFSPSVSSSASASSHDAADVISVEALLTEERLPEEASAPRLREGGELEEEKIIEVDKLVEKEAERGFLAEEVRSELSELRGIGGDKVSLCEETEERTDGFGSDIELEKEKVDHGLLQTDERLELEISVNSDKEREFCASDVEDDKVAQSSDLTFLQDQDFVRQEEDSSQDGKLSETEVPKDGRDNICKVEGPIDKMPREIAIPMEEESSLKKEHEFQIDSLGSVTVQEDVSNEAVISREFDKAKAEEQNLCEVEGHISKTATEDDSHLKELTSPEEISALVIESSEQKKGAEPIESSELEKGEPQEEEKNLSKAEGPTRKITELVGVLEKEKEKEFIQEEDWEGIERTDTEKQFAVAASYATSASGTGSLANLSNEVRLQLYGLHKVATEGPCYESHPLAVRTSTRAKWYVYTTILSLV
jgi:Acyl CoA binding protein